LQLGHDAHASEKATGSFACLLFDFAYSAMQDVWAKPAESPRQEQSRTSAPPLIIDLFPEANPACRGCHFYGDKRGLEAGATAERLSEGSALWISP